MHDPYLMLALAEGLGPAPVGALLDAADPAAVLASQGQGLDLPPRVLARLADPGLAGLAAAVRRRAATVGCRVLTPDAPDWPERLSRQALRPLVLFARGSITALHAPLSIAVVGSRTPTPYGADAAAAIASALVGAGGVLWSGLARGIDAIAHTTAVRAGAPTVAVLAGGLDAIYPREHLELAERIAAGGGCLVSELPPGRRASRGHFVRRNRLLAAGPRTVVVVEASLASGALHTARFAAECGTDVFAVPGPWRSERSQGCHRLIAEGCGLIESPAALLQSLGLGAGPARGTALGLAVGAEQAAILVELDRGPRPTDLLQRESGLDGAAFARALFALAHRGAIERLPGDLWRRA